MADATLNASQQTSWRRGWALLACVPLLLLAILHWNEQPSVFSGDWAQYVAHAKALYSGRSYTDIGYLYSPLAWTVGPRAYPPGLSLTILPLLALGDHAMAAMRVLMIASMAAFVVLASRRLSRDLHPVLALIAAAWCGVMLELDRGSVQVLSDLGFCALCWWVFCEVDSPHEWTRWRVARVILAGLGAMAYRVVGVAIPVAVVLYLLVAPKRDRRPLMIVLGVWALCGLGILAVASQLIPKQFLGSGLPSPLDVARQLVRWRLPVFDVQGYPFGAGRLDDAYHIVATLLLLVGAASLLKRGWRSMLVAFVLTYAAVLLAVEVFDFRYFWPLYPLMIGAQLEGGRLVLQRIQWFRERAVLASGVAAAFFVAAAVWQDRGQEVVAGFDAYPDALAIMDYARTAQSQGQRPRFLFANPRVFTLRTGVPAMGMVTAKPSVLMSELRRLRITHVVFGAFRDGCGPSSLMRTRQAYPSSFATVARYGRFEVATVTAPDSAGISRPAVPDTSPAEEGRCAAGGWRVEEAPRPATGS